MVMGLLVGAWVARYLGPSSYGDLSYVIAFASFFQVVSFLGLDGIAIRDIARERQDASVILGSVFRFRIASGFLCWLAAVGAMAVYRPGDHQTLLLTAIICGSFVFQAADTVDLWFQSQTRSKMIVLSRGTAYLLSSLLRVGFILFHAPLVSFAVAGLVESALTAVALFYSYRKFPASISWRFDWRRGAGLINESWPYLLSGLAVMTYMRIDQIMLREMLGTHELGIFTAALPLSTMWYFVPIMVSQSVGPAIAQKKRMDKVGYQLAIKRLYSIMWWIMLPLCVGIAILASPVIRVLFGPAFDASALVLAIHIFSGIPVALGSVQDLWNLNEKKNALPLKKALTGVVVNICLNLLLIPRYGAVGSAMATVVSHSISAVFANAVFDPDVLRVQLSSLFSFKAMIKG